MLSVFSNLSIRLKVILAFAIVLACALGLGVFSLIRLDSVNAAASVVGDNALPSERTLGELSSYTMSFRQLEATYALAQDAEVKAQEAASMERAGDQAAKALQELTRLAVTAEEHQLVERMEQQWRAYLALDRTFLSLRDPIAAITLYRGEMRTVFGKFQDALQAEIAFNANEGKEAVDLGTALGKSAQFWILVVLGLVALVCVAVGWWIIASVSKPIGAMTRVMRRLAEGDHATEISGVGRKDEIGQMAGALQVFKDSMSEAERLRAANERQQAEADAERKAGMLRLASEFDAGIKGVVNSVASQSTAMQTAAQAMTHTAEHATQQAMAVAASVEQASANVQTVATAAEELSASVLEIGRQVEQSSKIAGQAVAEADRTNATVESLNHAAQRIGEVVQLIETIAGQTNLLALNATIEAARAGDAGKGFAVVASEVKSLASQTAKATEEIRAQIGEIQGATGQTVEAIRGIGATIRQMSEIATAIASAVEEQGAATREIASNVQQAAQGTGAIAGNIEGVSRAAGETGAAAGQVLNSAGELARQSETLRRDVEAFLASVRAA